MEDALRPEPTISVERRAKRPRRWLLISVTAVLVCSASCGGCAIVGFKASAEGAIVARQTIEAVARPWNPEKVLQVAAPEWLQVSPPAQSRKFIAFVASRLGTLKMCRDVQNGPWRVFFGFNGLATFTSHVVECDFERGPASITMQLVRRNSAWAMTTMRINSDLLVSNSQ
jgi:hypothetical protein